MGPAEALSSITDEMTIHFFVPAINFTSSQLFFFQRWTFLFMEFFQFFHETFTSILWGYYPYFTTEELRGFKTKWWKDFCFSPWKSTEIALCHKQLEEVDKCMYDIIVFKHQTWVSIFPWKKGNKQGTPYSCPGLPPRDNPSPEGTQSPEILLSQNSWIFIWKIKKENFDLSSWHIRKLAQSGSWI